MYLAPFVSVGKSSSVPIEDIYDTLTDGYSRRSSTGTHQNLSHTYPGFQVCVF